MNLSEIIKQEVERGQTELPTSQAVRKQIEELDNLAKQLKELGFSLETKFEIPLRSRITATKISR